MKRIDSSSSLIEVRSGKSADRLVNVATVKFNFGAVALIEKKIIIIMVFNLVGEKDWRS